MKSYFENWLPPLGKRMWHLLTGYTISLFGSGMTESFLVIYLHQIREMDLAVSGVIIAVAGVAGVIAVPIAGWIGDRYGNDRSLVILLVVSAMGQVGMAFAQMPGWALAASFFTGAGAAGSWNALSAILAVSVRTNQRNDTFGVAFALQHLGFGIGSAVGGWILNGHSSLAFMIIFLLDAATFLFFAVFASFRLSGSIPRKGVKAEGDAFSGTVGYGEVIRDRALLLTIFLYAIFAVVLSGITTTAFPQWATGPAHTSIRVVGFAFLTNSCVIVGGQLFVLHLIRERRRTYAVSVTALLFGMGCLLIFVSGIIRKEFIAGTGFVLAMVLIGFGETLLFSSFPALVNNLAPDSLRGRYNSMFNLSWQVGSMAGPLLAGWMLGHHWGGGLFFTFTLMSVLIAVLAVVLGRIVPAHVNKG
ncbi:MAG TPA: MFS transporter [Bacillales bacterium]